MYDQEPKRSGRSFAVIVTIATVLLLGVMITLILLPQGEGVAQKAVLTLAPTQAAATPPSIAKATLAPKPSATAPASATPIVGESIGVPIEGFVLPTPRPNGEGDADAINPFVQVAKDASPSVVGISNRMRWFQGSQYDPDDTEYSSGSGVIISEDGYVITNQHVVEGAESLFVLFADGEEVEAHLVGEDEFLDIAVLKIDKEGLIPLKVGDSSAVQVGEFVLAIGNPLGNELFGTVTMGIVSATNRIIEMNDNRKLELLQTDAAINPGNSGGALINVRGELIGINTIKFSSSGYYSPTVEGLSFAVPVDNLLPVVKELIDTGKVVRPALGVRTVFINAYDARSMNLPVGMLIKGVYEGSPADLAGIQQGDVITHVDDMEITSRDGLINALRGKVFDADIALQVYQDGRTRDIVVKLFFYENPEE